MGIIGNEEAEQANWGLHHFPWGRGISMKLKY